MFNLCLFILPTGLHFVRLVGLNFVYRTPACLLYYVFVVIIKLHMDPNDFTSVSTQQKTSTQLDPAAVQQLHKIVAAQVEMLSVTVSNSASSPC